MVINLTMNDDFEEIDNLIKKFKDEEEMNNYLNKGIYPLSLQTSIHTPDLIPKLDDIKTPIPITPIKIDYSYQNSLIDKVTSLENAVRETLMRENKENKENKENECPICLEDMGTNNFIVPICEHKICIPCFIKNIKQNNNMSNNCCLCRKHIVSRL
jgi:hypothetical protein